MVVKKNRCIVTLFGSFYNFAHFPFFLFFCISLILTSKFISWLWHWSPPPYILHFFTLLTHFICFLHLICASSNSYTLILLILNSYILHLKNLLDFDSSILLLIFFYPLLYFYTLHFISYIYKTFWTLTLLFFHSFFFNLSYNSYILHLQELLNFDSLIPPFIFF